jgi:PAS domain S-box-containing protein
LFVIINTKEIGGSIQPLPLTKFWHRRIAEVGMFISAFVAVLYFLPAIVNIGSLSETLGISDMAAIGAGLTFFYCFITYLWVPEKHLGVASFIAYILLIATASILIWDTGGVGSAFVALWLCLAVFASVFGLLGSAAITLVAVSYGIYLVTQQTNAPYDNLVMLGFITAAPLIASFIIFHRRGQGNSSANSYNMLASELSQATSKAEVVINAIDEGVIAINNKGVIELINPAAQRIVGWGDKDAVGLDYRSVLKLTDKDDRAPSETDNPIAKVLTTGHDIQSKDFYVTTGAGKRVILSLVISPIGQIGQGAIIVFRDITKEQAEEREQAEFISTASHEMRTPVASIEGYLGLALNPQTAQIDAKARDFIEKAHGAAQHLGRLFQDLLDVSKAEDGRLSNHPGVVDVTSFISDVAEGLKPQADAKKLRMMYKPDIENTGSERTLAPVFYANVDNDHLREIISNLIENAIKYTPNGDVIIDIKGDDEHIVVSVQDSGIGIPPEDISHLFQKFYRVDNSQTREIGGTGLGLYLCRRLAEVMEGRLWVESDFGKGSTFYLELPRTSREDAMRLLDEAASQVETAAIETNDQPPLEQPTNEEADIFTQTTAIEEVPQPTAVPMAPAPTMPSLPHAPQATAVAPAAATPPQPVTPTLSTIEANPAAYTNSRRNSGVEIPNRRP